MTESNEKIKQMPFGKYRPYSPLGLESRTWPDKVIEKAPLWCAVDLRDGNQALIDPMDPERKLRMFNALLKAGFKEIEVGFPAASKPDYEFIRLLIEKDLIPEDVNIQVLVQCRKELIERTYKCLEGARSAIVHFYNSTSELQRRVVFKLDRQGIIKIATDAAKICRDLESTLGIGKISYEYSPESFTGTEIDFSLEICGEVMRALEPAKDEKVILNLPATVEMSTPNIYADLIEYFQTHIDNREKTVISLHPHNDRGTAIAAAELGVMAGADRVEGCLFGNGERTGNVDLVTLALNLFSQGVDPKLDLSDIDALRRVVEHCNRLPVHPRHPYVGDLVYTAFSGSHQDAIKKGMAAISDCYSYWEVPYLPIDPHHVGRSYEAVIRVNSQSGKGGVAYIMEAEHGFRLPRRLQIEFSSMIQTVAEDTGTEITPEQMWEVFQEKYLANTGYMSLVSYETSSKDQQDFVTAQVLVDKKPNTFIGAGSGPIAAFVNAINDMLDMGLDVVDYSEHAITSGASSQAVAYLEIKRKDAMIRWGVGRDKSILAAGLQAVVSAVNRFYQDN